MAHLKVGFRVKGKGKSIQNVVAFGSIMFAFAGASTFPTIQADMKDRSKFNISAVMAMGGNIVC